MTLASLLMLVFAGNTAMAQRGPAASPKATIKQMIGSTTMDIVYSRPSLAGRSLSELIPSNGDVWRTGANTSTSITFDKDVTFAGQALKAGSYSLWTIAGDDEWTIIVNSAVGNWGTQYKQKNMKETDVFRTTVKASKTSGSVETFRIDLTDFDNKGRDKANLELAWGNISVKIPIVVKN